MWNIHLSAPMIHSYFRLIAIGLLLTGCQTAAQKVTVNTSDPVVLSSGQIAQVKEKVNGVLKDPYSSHFGKIAAARTNLTIGGKNMTGVVICGEVNSKNSFGGYVGMTPFVGGIKHDSKQFELLVLGDDKYVAPEVYSTCRQAGVNL